MRRLLAITCLCLWPSVAEAQVGLPMTPVQASATAGLTTKLTTNGSTSVPGSITFTSAIQASRILVCNGGTNAAGGDPGTGVVAFVRMSKEATPTAAATDVPVMPGQCIVLMNPVPAGKLGIAVVSSGTTNDDILFTPIEGGF
jgi:hypothetical protein